MARLVNPEGDRALKDSRNLSCRKWVEINSKTGARFKKVGKHAPTDKDNIEDRSVATRASRHRLDNAVRNVLATGNLMDPESMDILLPPRLNQRQFARL